MLMVDSTVWFDTTTGISTGMSAILDSRSCIPEASAVSEGLARQSQSFIRLQAEADNLAAQMQEFETAHCMLAEITDYIYFLQRKVTLPDIYAAEVQHAVLEYALRSGRKDSLVHLEEEFADYDQQFPRD
ncbi:MAG TPA: hypothetical protein GYA08_23290 [Chloroflexi bacterium]|nr:hypothetical protein [Chloroflexota bacterium]